MSKKKNKNKNGQPSNALSDTLATGQTLPPVETVQPSTVVTATVESLTPPGGGPTPSTAEESRAILDAERSKIDSDAVFSLAVPVWRAMISPVAYANTPRVGNSFAPDRANRHTLRMPRDLTVRSTQPGDGFNTECTLMGPKRPHGWITVPGPTAKALVYARAFAATWFSTVMSAIGATRPPNEQNQYDVFVEESFSITDFLLIVFQKLEWSIGVDWNDAPLARALQDACVAHAYAIRDHVDTYVETAAVYQATLSDDSWAGPVEGQFFGATQRGQTLNMVCRALVHAAFIAMRGVADSIVHSDGPIHDDSAPVGSYSGTIAGLYGRLTFTPTFEPVYASFSIPFVADLTMNGDMKKVWCGRAIGHQELVAASTPLGDYFADITDRQAVRTRLAFDIGKHTLYIPQTGCYLVVGGPRSGKSTLLRKWRDANADAAYVLWGERDTLSNTIESFVDDIHGHILSGKKFILVDSLRLFADYGSKLQTRGISRLIWIVLTQLVSLARACGVVVIASFSVASSFEGTKEEKAFAQLIAAQVDTSATGYLMLYGVSDADGNYVQSPEGYVARAEGGRHSALIDIVAQDLVNTANNENQADDDLNANIEMMAGDAVGSANKATPTHIPPEDPPAHRLAHRPSREERTPRLYLPARSPK